MTELFHIAAATDWAQAQRDGEYRMSTRGRTLADEGYIHASTARQVLPVANAYYQHPTKPMITTRWAWVGAYLRWGVSRHILFCTGISRSRMRRVPE